MKIEFEVSPSTLERITSLLYSERIKVGRELIKAREDLEAVYRYDALDNSEASARMLDRAISLVRDLTDEATELLRIGKLFNHELLATLRCGHCSQ